MTNFLDAIAGVAAPMYSIDEAITVLQVIEAAYASARDGQAVQLPSSAAPVTVGNPVSCALADVVARGFSWLSSISSSGAAR